MARVDGTKERIGFRASYLAQEHAIRAQAHGRLQQVFHLHPCLALIPFRGDKGQEVGLDRLDLAGILNREDAFPQGDFLEDRVQEGRLPRGGATREQDRVARPDSLPDEIFDPAGIEAFAQGLVRFAQALPARDGDLIEAPQVAILAQGHIVDDLFADRERAAVRRCRRQDRLKAIPVRKRSREQGPFGVDRLAGIARDALCQMHDSLCRQSGNGVPVHFGAAEPLHEDFPRPIAADFDNLAVFKPRTDRLQRAIYKYGSMQSDVHSLSPVELP